MKQAWAILLISALTDLIITVGTSLAAAMMASGMAQIPNKATVVVIVLGGAVSAARTIQQALKATPETSAALTGQPSTVTTTAVTKTP